MTNEIRDDLYILYDLYKQFKLLHDFYMKHKYIKSEDDVRERFEYLKKNSKCKQRTELECLLWLLGEVE